MLPRIQIQAIPVRLSHDLQSAGALIKKFSWGENYPIAPISELQKAELCIGAWVGRIIVGFAAVSRHGSPDGLNVGDLWLGYAVVIPRYRRRRIFTRLYAECLKYVRKATGRVFCCTDNPIIIRFLMRHGWQFIRSSIDESGAKCVVFEYLRHLIN